MNTKTDSELIEEVVKQINALFSHYDLVNKPLLEKRLKNVVTTTIARVRGERDAHWASEIKWLHHYMTLEKNEDAVRSILEDLEDTEQVLSEWMAGDNCATCDCHINLEKGKHWPGCVHYKKEPSDESKG